MPRDRWSKEAQSKERHGVEGAAILFIFASVFGRARERILLDSESGGLVSWMNTDEAWIERLW
jgi:hypothetical protein